MNRFKTGWYLIYTRPRHEKKVSHRLSEMELSCYLPVRKTLRNWCDRKQWIEEPLFPSYVFVQLNDMRSYYASLSVEGVIHYVRFGNEVALVPETVIDNVRLVVEKGKDVEVSANHFQPGQQLLIAKGPLCGLCCEVVDCKGSKKILVRISLLQRNLLISLPTGYLADHQ